MRTRQYLFGTSSGAVLFLAAGYLAQSGLINWSLALVAAAIFGVSLCSWGLQWFKASNQDPIGIGVTPTSTRGPH